VEVDDMDAGAFRILLEFAYTDALPEPGTMSREEAAMCQHLLVAADRYDMERLKMICEARLRKHIDAGSAATILALAELHGCPRLKDACFRFLETPTAMAAVAEAEGFEHLSRSCPKDLVFWIIDR
jgi:speckle-type POZ protein